MTYDNNNIFAKIFDNTNQFFFSNFSNKYEITYFLNRNHYKKNQKLYIYSPDTLIRRPNLQNSVNNKFYLFEIIEDDLFVSKTKENYFKLSKQLIIHFIRITFSTIIMGICLQNLIYYFDSQLSFESNYKFIYLIFLVILSILIYFAFSLITKAFKLNDIKIKY